MKKFLFSLFILVSFLFNVFTAKAESNIALPDLVITDFTWSPETPIKKSPIGYLHVYLTVKNIGNASVVLPENMRVSIYKENKSYGGFGLGTAYYKLEPGDSKVFDFNTTQSPNILERSGTFDLILAVDDAGGSSSYFSSGLINESNEYNNTFYKKIKINDSYDTPDNDSYTNSSPIVSFPDARYVDSTAANLEATVTFLGNPKMVTRGICYTPSMAVITPGLTSGATCVSSVGTSDEASIAIYPTELIPNTEYKFRGYATNSINMTGYSVEGYFKTKSVVTSGPRVKIISPNGGEIFTQNSQNKISFAFYDISNNRNQFAQFALVDSRATNSSKISNYIKGWIVTANETSITGGSITWDAMKVCDLAYTQCSYVEPGQYKILAQIKDINGNLILDPSSGSWDLSDSTFTITSSSLDNGCSNGQIYNSITGQICSKEVVSRYKVLTPNGNEGYNPGDKVKVMWDSYGPHSGTNVSIGLVDDSIVCNKGVVGCQSKFIIAYNISNVGSYIWNTNSKMSGPSTGPNSVLIQPGNKYRIEVCGTTVNYCDYSDSYFSINSNDTLFKMKISGELSSSGASRRFDADLNFGKNILSSGTQKYFVGQGGGCTSNCERYYTCVVSDHKWVDEVNGGDCKINVYSPLTKSEVDKDIENKVIVPMSQCGHLDICYEIISSVDSQRDTGCIAGQNYSSTTGKACALGLYKNTTPIARTLKRGVIGDDVKRLQEFLQVYADGVFGRGTAAKVKEWQLKNGLYPDGSFGSMSRIKAGM